MFTKITLSLTLAVSLAILGQNSDERVPQRSVGLVPINDLAGGNYKGFTGGLYPGGSNTIPTAHLAAGVAAAKRLQSGVLCRLGPSDGVPLYMQCIFVDGAGESGRVRPRIVDASVEAPAVEPSGWGIRMCHRPSRPSRSSLG